MNNSNPQDISINTYNYDLPDERIAKYPLAQRDSSQLLVYKNGEIKDAVFSQLSQFVPQGSLLVFNNTKVIQARMHFYKSTGAKIEIFCLEPHAPNDYALSFQQTQSCSWVCLVGNSRKWKDGEVSQTIATKQGEVTVVARRVKTMGDSHIIEFEWNNSDILFSDILEAGGELPIPPYLNRDTEESDTKTYQTVYSKIKGSVAAPTAGLHFTDEVLDSVKKAGNKLDEVTLHVGAGTFKPVKAELIKGHEMHSEFITVRKEFISHLLQHQGNVIAVGTTSVRTLESLYYIGESLEHGEPETLFVGQWQPYSETSNKISREKALQNILAYLEKHDQTTLVASTQIMIAPSYQFKIVNGIVTNFHQPQSTLLLLVSAFVGEEKWESIYKHALNNNYRFLSYGDSSLLLK